ncbi:PucR family transcriptional regulator [Zhihengliuella alba]|uniref:PucR family transcriptional regulator n=1 Tax=Zhihengliuella alba TaxID=547018 RepID=A0ABP7DRK0_9MICC
MAKSLTIRDLVASPVLGTRTHSGAAGLDRPVLWAHSCELKDPARWLQPHELLMTVGMCVPAGSDAQRAFIADLDDAGLAGIAIGDHGFAPPLTPALADESNARGFPVLLTERQTPFVALSRMVASFGAEEQSMGVLRLAKLYNVAGRRGTAEKRSGRPLAELFSTKVTVVDDETSCVVIGDGTVAPASGRRHPLRTLRPTHLLLESEEFLDGLSMVHLSQVLEVDANELLQAAVDHVDRGEEVLTRSLASRMDAGRALTEHWGLERPGYRVMVTECDVAARVPLSLALTSSPAVCGQVDGRQVVAVPVAGVPDVRERLDELGLVVGASAVHHDEGDLGGAIEEAVSEYQFARARGQRWREFRGERLSLLGRSRSEREHIVQGVLGPLAGEDPKMTSLRETLFAFLDHDQNWNETAKAQNLHRQSVAYRMNRVEELTGRSVRRTQHLAEFWLARTAWEQYVVERGS